MYYHYFIVLDTLIPWDKHYNLKKAGEVCPDHTHTILRHLTYITIKDSIFISRHLTAAQSSSIPCCLRASLPTSPVILFNNALHVGVIRKADALSRDQCERCFFQSLPFVLMSQLQALPVPLQQSSTVSSTLP